MLDFMLAIFLFAPFLQLYMYISIYYIFKLMPPFQRCTAQLSRRLPTDSPPQRPMSHSALSLDTAATMASTLLLPHQSKTNRLLFPAAMRSAVPKTGGGLKRPSAEVRLRLNMTDYRTGNLV